jgi:SAM-dependent methyltransferase
MENKPKQFGENYASIFQDASVVSAYRHRPAYPDETFAVLSRLIPASVSPRIVLDVGCGTGFIARPFAAYVDHVEAVDISERMIAMAKTLPGGERSNITWIAAGIETARLFGPYALIVAAASLHWVDWKVALPRFANHLVPGGLLVLVEEFHSPLPWEGQIGSILGRYSMNSDFSPYSIADVAEELEQRRLFQLRDRFETTPVPFQQSIGEYIESFHGRNGFSLDRMDPRAAAQFQDELRGLIEPYCPRGVVEQQISARILWGVPMRG